jgi:predicted transcriptional regulator
VGVAEEHTGIAIIGLMCTSQVSLHQLTRHLQVLLKRSLLEYDEQQKFYKITTRGLRFIELYNKMAELLERS